MSEHTRSTLSFETLGMEVAMNDHSSDTRETGARP